MINSTTSFNQMKRIILDNLSCHKPVAPSDSIDDVIVLLGSSRSGSTLLYQTLAQHPELNSLPGEDITYLRLHQAGTLSNLNCDDRLLNETIDYASIAHSLMSHAGTLSQDTPISTMEKINRFLLQWPNEAYDLKRLQTIFDTTSDYQEALMALGVDLKLYENKLEAATFDPPENRLFIEEPPFLFPVSRIYTKKKRNILVLKSSSNAYRMNHIKQLFPNARYHYLLISRRPEGTINGLMDGWNSSGFHSHFVGHLTQLKMAGYPSKNWWKFDLPPDWKNMTDSPLPEVCSFQWASAYNAILNFLEDQTFSTINYEDFFTPQKAFLKINQFLNSIDLAPLPENTTTTETMMTKKPGLDRWLEKKDLITTVVNQHSVQTVLKRLQENQ